MESTTVTPLCDTTTTTAIDEAIDDAIYCLKVGFYMIQSSISNNNVKIDPFQSFGSDLSDCGIENTKKNTLKRNTTIPTSTTNYATNYGTSSSSASFQQRNDELEYLLATISKRCVVKGSSDGTNTPEICPINFSYSFSNITNMTTDITLNHRPIPIPISIDESELSYTNSEMEFLASILIHNVATALYIKSILYAVSGQNNFAIAKRVLSRRVFALAYKYITFQMERIESTSSIQFLHSFTMAVMILKHLIRISIEFNDDESVQYYSTELCRNYHGAMTWSNKSTSFFGHQLIRQTAATA